jgi:hypothetical protein
VKSPARITRVLLGPAGQVTGLDNLVLLCRRHHIRWHQGRLQLWDLQVPWRSTTFFAGADPPHE